MEAKGIRREIRPFALTDFLGEPDADRFIRCDGEGISVRIDLARVSEENKNEAARRLAEAIERLGR